MKILHTSDWHVGKQLRGRSRAGEHRSVLAEIAAIANGHAVDLVVVAGDLYDSATPSGEADEIVYQSLLALAAGGTRPVVVVGGNHDSAPRLAAVAPVFAASGVTVVARPTAPDRGGVVEVPTANGLVRLALLPFPSQRGIVTAEQLMAHEAADHGQDYAERVRRILGALATAFDRPGDAVNVIVAHLMVMGGTMGGGERGAHTVFDYWVPTTAFPAAAHYVALGHLHRAQRLDGPAPIHYCGSPLQLDFGETANAPQVNVVEATPGRAGVEVTAVPLTTGRRLRTLRGTPESLELQAPELQASEHQAVELQAPVVGASVVEGAAHTADSGAPMAGPGPDHLRLVVESPPLPGLADRLRQRFPTAVEVVLAPPDAPDRPRSRPDRAERTSRSPQELFAGYLVDAGIDDARLQALFDQLVDDELHTDTTATTEPGTGSAR